MFTFTKLKNKGGFTLIELLIVIAIIGVLAATVVVSLGSQTDEARTGSVKIGVSSIRNLATVTVVEGVKQGSTVCNDIYTKVSGEKDTWIWKATTPCTKAADADGKGAICCASSGDKWVVWGKGSGSNYYCADSSGYAGENAGTGGTAKTVSSGTGIDGTLGCK